MGNPQITEEVDNANKTYANKNEMNSMLELVAVAAMKNIWSKKPRSY